MGEGYEVTLCRGEEIIGEPVYYMGNIAYLQASALALGTARLLGLPSTAIVDVS